MLKSLIAYAVAGVLFFLAGFVTRGHFERGAAVESAAKRHHILQMGLKSEQDFLAARSWREGDTLRAVVHRWNAVDAEARHGGFMVFRPGCAEKLAPVVWGWDETPFGEGVRRALLARTLEAVGAIEEAERQWVRAQELTGSTRESLRALTERFIELESDDLGLRAEQEFLGLC